MLFTGKPWRKQKAQYSRINITFSNDQTADGEQWTPVNSFWNKISKYAVSGSYEQAISQFNKFKIASFPLNTCFLQLIYWTKCVGDVPQSFKPGPDADPQAI